MNSTKNNYKRIVKILPYKKTAQNGYLLFFYQCENVLLILRQFWLYYMKNTYLICLYHRQ